MRIVFMGTPQFAVPSLKALVEAGHEVCGVFSQPDKPVGRHQNKLKPTPVKECALSYQAAGRDIPVYQPEKLRDGTALAILKELVRERRVAVILSLHELDLAQRISDRILCIRGDGIDRCGTPEEIFSGGYIRQLYGVERGSYCEEFGCPELEPVRGEPQIFVIGGNGSGIPVYRRLQRQGVPFAAGILPENDVDHPVAKALAAEVIAQRAYHPIGEDTFRRALSILEGCGQVLLSLIHI